MKYFLTEDIVNLYLEEKKKIELMKKINELSNQDRQLFFEMYNSIHPNIITERQWYNTAGDIAGIFDPTGGIDLINGISYWRQNDYFSAILSWISALPYLGDAIAKPVLLFLKADAKLLRALNLAVKAKDANKIASLATSKGGWLLKFFKTIAKWIGKLISFTKRAFKRTAYRTIGAEVDSTLKVFQDVGKKVNEPQPTTKPITQNIKQDTPQVSKQDGGDLISMIFGI